MILGKVHSNNIDGSISNYEYCGLGLPSVLSSNNFIENITLKLYLEVYMVDANSGK